MATKEVKDVGLIQEFGSLIHVPNGLSEKDRSEIVQRLNRNAANLQLLYMRYKKDHWTIRGRHFHSLHLFFEELANEVLAQTDVIAERVVGLGGVVVSMPDEIAEHATIGQLPAGIHDTKTMLQRELQALETMEVEIREDMERADELGDPTTNDLLNAVLDLLEKQTWMINSQQADLD
jgi:starvation-inducible DNA-binding protein